MASNTENVKLGVCRVTFGGADLGYTKGGVEVTVTSETHKVEVDQFGHSEINEYIMGRTVKVRVPMAETTLENLVRVMPGATLVEDGGTKASGTITFTVNPVADDTITINGVVWTFKATASTAYSIAIGADVAATIQNAATKLNASTNSKVIQATYTAGASDLTITYDDFGVVGNSFTLAASVATVSGATLTGGVDSTAVRVDVTNGIGTSLLDIAAKLTLHPVGNAEDDLSEDFVIPRAATAGAIQFAYKLDEERIFPVEFSGYPDPTTKLLFSVGDDRAV